MHNPEPNNNRYGTLPWFEHEYAKVPADPWGLTWRPSQQLRYHRVLTILNAVEGPLVNVMDVGCATGDFTNLLFGQFRNLRELLGIDFVDSAIERARHKFPHLTFSKESVLGIGEKYPERFDLITCLEMIYYIPSTKQIEALRSLRAVLRPGGYAVFSSMISSAPYFHPSHLLKLLEGEFEIVKYEVIHLRQISLLERLGDRLSGVLANSEVGRRRFGRLPLRSVVVLERWCRCLKSVTASHTIVLVRARS